MAFTRRHCQPTAYLQLSQSFKLQMKEVQTCLTRQNPAKPIREYVDKVPWAVVYRSVGNLRLSYCPVLGVLASWSDHVPSVCYGPVLDQFD